MKRAEDPGPAFQLVVARWLLTQAEVRALVAGACGRDGVCPGEPDPAGLRRMSLVVALEAGLRGLLGRSAAAEWVRRPAPGLGGVPPLQAMTDEPMLVALVRALVGQGVVDAAGAAHGAPARDPS